MSKENSGVTNQLARKIYFYILRNTTIDEKFKIKVYINDDIKYTFTRIETFDEQPSTTRSYIYSVGLDLINDKQGHLFISLPEGLLPIRNYQLRLSRKFLQLDTTFRDYDDDKDRYITNFDSTTHYFLFDVNFAKNFVDSPPGRNLFDIKIKYIDTLSFSSYRRECSFLESIMFIYLLYSSSSNV